jgi:UDP-glucose 4-epimerase
VRVAVTGASGNVGTALLHALSEDDRVDEIVGIARRVPTRTPDEVRWVARDVTGRGLADAFRGCDAVVHLAWQIQPGRDQRRLWEVNVLGSQRVFDAVASCGVRTLVYASSIGAYSPTDDPGATITEEHPTHGVATSTYSRQKAYVERLLDLFELRHPSVRVVRLRPALIFQQAAASEVRRFFLGSLFPNRLATTTPVLPIVDGLTFQAVHATDVADAYRRAITTNVAGAFNIAADPVLSLRTVAELIGARTIRLPARLLRPAAAASWRLRVHPVEPGWVDLALHAPIMDTTRSRDELGWSPRRSATSALEELLGSISRGDGGPTPTLSSDRERSRTAELPTGQGARYANDPSL